MSLSKNLVLSDQATRGFCVVLVVLASWQNLTARERSPELRAKPPTFSKEEKLVFPENAFLELQGERPQRVDPRKTKSEQQSNKSSTPRNDSGPWSDWVEADILETEIKRQLQQLSKALQSPARFKSGSYRSAEDAMGIISLMFAVTVEHDEAPRWQDIADRLREVYATGDDSLDADDASFKRASRGKEDLSDLIRGGRPTLDASKQEIDWSRYASRGAVMRRMKVAQEDRLASWAIDRRELSDNLEEVRHESQMLALLAEALVQPEAYDGDDEDYQAYARELRDAANELAIAAEQEDQPAAERAFNQAQKSCLGCHADYRG